MSTTTAPRVLAPSTRRWTLDRTHTTVDFAVKSLWGIVTVRGRFTGFDGWYEQGPDGGNILLEIDAETVDTGNGLRDRHLRSAHFLDADRHELVRFTSSRVTAGQGSLEVTGTLVAAGATLPLTFDATMIERGEALRIEARTTVDHRRFGMSAGPLGMIRGPVEVHVTAWLR